MSTLIQQDVPVVALGGGHGLAATLSALRLLTKEITAIVTVADDGGSSGQLRKEFGIIPPGDLRMALAALCGDDDGGWAQVVQHRFGGEGPLAGHALGNLLLAALWDLRGDTVAGLDAVARLLHAEGRVLPMAAVPLSLTAQVRGAEGRDEITTVTGQVAVASTSGSILSIALEPANPPATKEALDAISAAEYITLGPGSWYSSVIAHLLVPEQRAALRQASATKILILNIVDDDHDGDELRHKPAEELLDVIHDYAPEVHFDYVVVDPGSVHDHDRLAARAESMNAQLLMGDMSRSDRSSLHDAERLATVLASVITSPVRSEGARTLPRLTR